MDAMECKKLQFWSDETWKEGKYACKRETVHGVCYYTVSSCERVVLCIKLGGELHFDDCYKVRK